MKLRRHQPTNVRRALRRFREGKITLEMFLQTVEQYLEQFPAAKP